MNKLIVSALLCLPMLAHADAGGDCQARLAGWMKTLHPGRALDTEHAACKVWPADASLTLAVQPLPQAGASDDGGTYDVEVLVADSRSGAIVAHLYEPAAITSDAVRFSHIDLDTARYQLTPSLRAFGVRATYEGSSRANPYEAQALSLYVLDGRTLRRVVADLNVMNSSGEWDTDCAGNFSKTVRTLAIGPAGQTGYAALNVAESTVNSESKPVGGKCVSTDRAPGRTTATLNYDGSAYRVPKAMHYE